MIFIKSMLSKLLTFLVGTWFIMGNVIAQENRTIIFDPIDFAQALERAAGEDKLIFFDAYTSWCAPCKWMEQNVFTKAEVAEYFNENFVNVKFDCEKGEGVDLAKRYKISSFPTYLFLDSEGTLIYRTQSRMQADAFLTHAKQANDKQYQIPTLVGQFSEKQQDPDFLLRYIQVMDHVDQTEVKKALLQLEQVADEAFLLSGTPGWKVVNLMAKNPTDRYGSAFFKHYSRFQQIAPPAEFFEKEVQLRRMQMYRFIRENDESNFKEGIRFFETAGAKSSTLLIDVAMFRVDWIATYGDADEFSNYTKKLSRGLLKNDDEKLSFIARRYGKNYERDQSLSPYLKACYRLAKRAVTLNPNSYSNQGTFAELCISMGKKREAIQAAQRARQLADLETSKIQGIAQQLLDRANAM